MLARAGQQPVELLMGLFQEPIGTAAEKVRFKSAVARTGGVFSDDPLAADGDSVLRHRIEYVVQAPALIVAVNAVEIGADEANVLPFTTSSVPAACTNAPSGIRMVRSTPVRQALVARCWGAVRQPGCPVHPRGATTASWQPLPSRC